MGSTEPPSRYTISLQDSNFTVNGHLIILSDVPSNILVSTTNNTAIPGGCFVGFDTATSASRHVTPIGKLKDTKFMSLFRFKLWWTTQWTGRNGRDLEHETQLLLLDTRPYVLILPIIEGSFRASLQSGGSNDNVDICVESGSESVTERSFSSVIYMEAGEDPFRLVRDAMRAIRTHLGTFRLLEEKIVPSVVDKFGWCTWDAFYLRVNPSGVLDGVKRLVEGGVPPRMVLIDDGWQSVCADDEELSDEGAVDRTVAGEQMPCRLVRVEENWKFRDYTSTRSDGCSGMGAFVRDLKEGFGVEEVYVWHALCGYWGGVRSRQGSVLPESRFVKPKLSDGAKMTMEDLAVDKIVSSGVGLVQSKMANEFFERLHSYLKSVGIDGVKVDVIQIMEMLCEDYGGRVSLAKSYYTAITNSINAHLDGNRVIASMEHCNDFMLLGTQSIALGRVGDDFWCITKWLQGLHMAHCAYNSYWMGNFIQPDWDMFQSTHVCAEFHAASRAISGGPVYVSDRVGEHDFELLRKLVLPDGKLLRCEWYALPTRDVLFEDVVRDGRTGLKIWNVNQVCGVVGIFNCQGGGWNRENRRNQSYSDSSQPVKCRVKPNDIEWNNTNYKLDLFKGVEKFAMYFYTTKKVFVVSDSTEIVELILEPFTFELIVVSPVAVVAIERSKSLVEFAPIGFVNMMNGGGAIQSFQVDGTTIQVHVKGYGQLKVFASVKPMACKNDGVDVEFEYDDDQFLVTLHVSWSGSSSLLSKIHYFF